MSGTKGTSNTELYFTIFFALLGIVGIIAVALDYSNVIKIGIFQKRKKNDNSNSNNNHNHKIF